MNELFHELYGAYYAAAEQLIKAGELKKSALWGLLSEFLSPDGTAEASESILVAEDWSFLQVENGRVSPLVSAVERPLTNLERAFLRTVANDPRTALFVSDEQLAAMKVKLGEGPGLFSDGEVKMIDRAADGDPYGDASYRARVRALLAAMDKGAWVTIGYRGVKGRQTENLYFPFALEYSGKDDRFRVKCRQPDGRESTLNADRMESVREAEAPLEASGEVSGECEEPLTAEVLPERGGAARFLQEFSYLRKETELDEKTGAAIVKLWYPKCDESEIIIRLLGFGPVVKVRGPESVVKQIRVRVRMQMQRARRQAER